MRKYSDPLLFAVLVFAEYFWNVTPANSEGRLYIVYYSIAACTITRNLLKNTRNLNSWIENNNSSKVATFPVLQYNIKNFWRNR